MTHDEHNETEATPAAEEAAAPAGHYWADIKERRVLVKNLTPGQSMALGGLLRRADSSDYATSLDILGKLMLLFDTLIPGPEDRAWLEERIITDEVTIEDFAFVFRGRTTSTDTAPAKKPRRGR